MDPHSVNALSVALQPMEPAETSWGRTGGEDANIVLLPTPEAKLMVTEAGFTFTHSTSALGKYPKGELQ